MIGSIFFKEYLKIRWPFAMLPVLNGLLMAYIFIGARHLFTMDHAEIVWYRVMHLEKIHYDRLKYAPAATGLLIGCFQYLPEMLGERLRLSLHLPVSSHGMILVHVLVGLTAVCLAILLDLVALALITAGFFPIEVVFTALLTAIPWGFAGVAVYLGVTLALLKPSYRVKLFNFAVAAGTTSLFLYLAEPESYRHCLPSLGFTQKLVCIFRCRVARSGRAVKRLNIEIFSRLTNPAGRDGSAHENVKLFLSEPLVLPMLLMLPSVLLPAYRFRFRKIS